MPIASWELQEVFGDKLNLTFYLILVSSLRYSPSLESRQMLRLPIRYAFSQHQCVEQGLGLFR